MEQIYVTNTNGFTHSDRYAGTDYVFPPSEKVLIDVDAARHMFGFGVPDKTETLTRIGWANAAPGEPADAGVRKLAAFIFSKARVVEEVVSDAAPSSSEPAAAEVSA